MIYRNKERAMEVAKELRETMLGHCPTYACRVAEGWTVICSWRGAASLLGKYGVLEVE